MKIKEEDDQIDIGQFDGLMSQLMTGITPIGNVMMDPSFPPIPHI